MTVLEDVRALVEKMKQPLSVMTASRTGWAERAATRESQDPGACGCAEFDRRKNYCSVCGSVKLVIRRI